MGGARGGLNEGGDFMSMTAKCYMFLESPWTDQTGIVGKVGNLGKVRKVGKVGKEGHVGNVGNLGKVGKLGQMGKVGNGSKLLLSTPYGSK